MRWFIIRPRRQLTELYYFSLLFSLAQALVLIFEPVFFYSQGLGLAMIALYYAMHYTLYMLLLPWGARFAARFGMEQSLVFSTPLFILYFVALALLPKEPNLFWVAIGLLTLHKIFYWPAFYTVMARYGDGANRGTEQSWMHLLNYGVGVLGPLVGGLVVVAYGFPALFVAAAIVVAAASLALLKTAERDGHEELEYAAPWRVIFNSHHWRMVVGTLGQGEYLVHQFFWPLFMFIVLGSAGKLGFVAALSAVPMVVTAFVVGEASDRHTPRRVLRWSTPFLSLAHVVSPLATTPLKVLLAGGYRMMAASAVNISFLTKLYADGKRLGPLKYLTAFEIVLALSKAIVGWLLVLIFLSTTPYAGFAVAFLLAALLTWFYAVL